MREERIFLPEEAYARLKNHLPPFLPGKEEVPILQSLGRRLAQEIISPVDLPGFDRATMDGYAVRARDTFGASEGMPAYLTVVGEVAMGETPLAALQPNQAVRIATGGMLPKGADAVVMVEYTEELDPTTVGITKPVAPGENMVGAADDFAAGTVILPAGHRVRPQDIGAMAAIGLTGVEVWKKPRVAVISSGNELVPPEQKPTCGQIRDINSYTIAAAVSEMGGIPLLYGIVKDDEEALRTVLAKALAQAEMAIISGGSSVGTRDVTAKVIDAMGKPGVLVHGVAVKPGKPTILAVVDGKPVFGLPGHPVSALSIFRFFVAPLLSELTGVEANHRLVTARLGRNMASAAGRVDHLRVVLAEENGETWAQPVLGKSGLISTLVKADGVVVIPAAKEGLQAGETVEVSLF